MRKIILVSIIFIVLLITIFYPNKKVENNNTIKVAEVTHSLFYTPFYVALNNGYFNDVGLNVDLILTPGADKVAASLLANEANIGLAGIEASIYIYNQNPNNYIMPFASLTKRDGQYIVSRQKETLTKDTLKNKEILVGRKGGMPAINFLEGIKTLGLKENELNINYSVEFASLDGAFIGGTGDYVNLFEPNATKMEEQNLGYVIGNIGSLSKEVPYTCFMSSKDYINNNKEVINKFKEGLTKGLLYVKESNIDDIVKAVKPSFKELDDTMIKKIILRYQENDTWYDNTTIKKEAYNNITQMLLDNKLIDTVPDFNLLIYE